MMSNDYTPPPLICPTCGGPSISPGPCPVCMATPDDPALDANAWIAEALSDVHQASSGREAGDALTAELYADAAEPLCPSCSGPSPTGGPCAACDAGHESDVYDDAEVDEVAEARRPPDHHIYPEQFRAEFEDADVDIDAFTATLYEFQHHLVHSEGWNADWAMFFESADLAGVPPNRADVEDFGRFLMDKYGFPEAPLHAYGDQSGDLGPYIS